MYVFDSNILIYHLNAALKAPAQEQIEAWIIEGAAVSVITRIEVLGFDQPAAALQQASALLALFEEIALNEQVVRQTIALRQTGRMRTPDAIIAASALVKDVPLVTHNRRDFERIEGLRVLDPLV